MSQGNTKLFLSQLTLILGTQIVSTGLRWKRRFWNMMGRSNSVIYPQKMELIQQDEFFDVIVSDAIGFSGEDYEKRVDTLI